MINSKPSIAGLLIAAAVLLSGCSPHRQFASDYRDVEANVEYAFVYNHFRWPWATEVPISVGSGRFAVDSNQAGPRHSSPEQSDYRLFKALQMGRLTLHLEVASDHPCVRGADGPLQVSTYTASDPSLWRDVERAYLVRLRYTSLPDFAHRMRIDPEHPEVTFYFHLHDCQGEDFAASVFGRRVTTAFHELAHIEHSHHIHQHGRYLIASAGVAEFIGFDMQRLHYELVADLASLCSLYRMPPDWAGQEFSRLMATGLESSDIAQRYLAALEENGLLARYKRNPARFNRGRVGASFLSPILAARLMQQMLDTEPGNSQPPLPRCENLFQPEGIRAVADWLELLTAD